MEVWLITLGAFIAVLSLAVGFRAALFGAEGKLARRTGQVSARARGTRVAVAGKTSVKREDPGSGRGLDAIARRYLPKQSELKAKLARTGYRISLGQFLALSVLTGVAAAIAIAVFSRLGPASASTLGLLAAVIIPNLVVARLTARRTAAFINLFPEAIELIVRGLRSGIPVSECVATVGREMQDPVGIEFRTVADAVRFGKKLDQALWEMADRMQITDVKFFVISLSVQQETGGNLAETLANLADIIRRRRQMKLKVKAMSSEAKASAVILGLLPFVLTGVIYLSAPGYLMTLVDDIRGNIMVGIGLVVMGAGIFIMSRMVKFDI